MPDFSDATEQVTRKVGPLPLWGWALAVAGAVIGWRILSGRPALGGSSGGGSSINPSGETITATDNSAIDTLTATVDALAERLALERQEQAELDLLQSTTVAGLSTTVGNLGSTNTLLQQLSDAINKRATALDRKERYTRALNDLTARYNDKKITKATYTSKASEYNKVIASETKNITTFDKLIADIRAKIAKVGVTA